MSATDGIAGRVLAVVADETDRPLASIAPGHRLGDDLGVDSLDFIKLIAAIEDAFAIRVEDDAAAAVETVAELIAVVEAAAAITRP